MSQPEPDFDVNTTLLRVLIGNASEHPSEIAFREKTQGIWKQLPWSDVGSAVLHCAAALQSVGVQAGKGVLILGDNRSRLYMGMVAAGAVRAFAVPVYPNATLDEILYITQNVDICLVFAEDQEQVDKALDLRHRGASIEYVVYDDARGLRAYKHPGLLSWTALLERGATRLASEPGLRQQLLDLAQPDDPAVLIHSSGTTGQPKGLVLTHFNVLSAVRNAHRAGAFGVGESVLAYLPMAWVGDFVLTLCAGIALRFAINIPEDASTVLLDLREIAPSFYLAAPRSWDSMLTMVQVRMEDSPRLKRAIYGLFMNSAIDAERRKLAGQKRTVRQRLLRPLGEWLVMGPIKDQLGLTRLRGAFTGGEAIGEDTFIFYRALGINLRQLYGQTESAALVAMQSPNEVRLHTVGRPLPGVEARIADSGEILIRSDSIFREYFGNREATCTAFDEGWLRTGDAGYIEEGGHLVVLGRVSEVVYTAGGERYIPNYIENRLKFSPYIKDSAVLGQGRETLAALLCIDLETVGHWAEVHGVSYMSYADLSQKPEVLDLLVRAVQRVNDKLPEALRLRSIVSLPKEFDADDGEITRNRKLRRNVVEERYASVIDAVYAAQPSVVVRLPIVYETGATGVLERELRVKVI